ncbi:hypothetical protein HAX54_022717, partial [Datura stramonium]|nr:hypothetical protein [Datura stramonium]
VLGFPNPSETDLKARDTKGNGQWLVNTLGAPQHGFINYGGVEVKYAKDGARNAKARKKLGMSFKEMACNCQE